ncbi:MATE family efflux transporter, partial [Catenibacterium sp.]
LYGIGIPATLNIALPSVLISVLNAILISYSAIYVVVLGIYYKLQTFVFMPSNGIIQGIRPLVGYNYGAREYDRINKIYKLTLGLSLIIMIAGTLLCFV